jgi:pyruvate/2-oxoglutarate/acetoin dehydrogenase E1 component
MMRKIRYREALREALREEMQRDSRVFVIGEDVGRYGGAYAVTQGLLQEFGPKRIIDAPMSEAIIIGAALGAAVVGGRPVAEIMYIDFATLAMDQIVNQAAKLHCMFGGQLKAPLVIRTQQGTGRGAGPQHSQSLEAWFAHVPGLKVVMPATPYDAKGLLKSAIRDDNPVMFIEHKSLYALEGEVPEEEYTVPLGVADIKRLGNNVTLIAYSNMVHTALAAAQELSQIGISAEVIDLRTLVPLDMDTVIASVTKTRRAVVVHEASVFGGFGAEIAASLQERLFDILAAPVRRLGGLHVPLPAHSQLEKQVVPGAAQIVQAVKEMVSTEAAVRAASA